ncbi:metalloprotease [Peribacillus simplex]|uniref:Metalloprotease n=1 Tax=Peribacillus simplex TaxID=1478 RepID=A0A9X8ZIK7_9BACI|nr:neutral zinc metallopeptidase [Peribacillus simplex]TKH04702.1 metalloprotease [Peribacillus simplex]TKH13404.1 metalloprotease [Peribacillus simplex]
MKWKGRQGSSNVEDRRGMSGKGMAGIGGGVGLVIVLIVMLLGGNPSELLGSLNSTESNNGSTYVETDEEKELAQFVSVVLAETEQVWTEEFRENGLEYKKPNLVLYSGSVESACGMAASSVGPFYCPGDMKLYIDLSFYQELKQEFQAPGDFAMAYVIAHEVGHHVQTLLGTTEKEMPDRSQVTETEYNRYSVRLELQADYLAGVWAHHVQGENLLEKGDLEEALNAASGVGDDRIQEKAQGYVVPDSFTHGTSEQRKRWFNKGFKSGDMNEGNTFKANNL